MACQNSQSLQKSKNPQPVTLDLPSSSWSCLLTLKITCPPQSIEKSPPAGIDRLIRPDPKLHTPALGVIHRTTTHPTIGSRGPAWSHRARRTRCRTLNRPAAGGRRALQSWLRTIITPGESFMCPCGLTGRHRVEIRSPLMIKGKSTYLRPGSNLDACWL